MIKRFEVKNLNGFTSFKNSFNPDINVITGLNGSGKTSVLRLIWYLVSANIERVFDDCSFDELLIETSQFKLNIKTYKLKNTIAKIAVDYSDTKKNKFNSELNISDFRNAIEVVNEFTINLKNPRLSVMFPTFRRIEGGYTYLNQKQPKHGLRNDRDLKDSVEVGLIKLSQRLGVYGHMFVSSISTSDIKSLLTSSYADVSSQTNELHAKMAREISLLISNYQRGTQKQPEGIIIEKISKMVNEISEVQTNKLAPFTTINTIIKEFFISKSIQISDAVIFGSDKNILDSDVLSAGEKQFLGFLAYNALMNNGIMFIDEPELSLHVDWQRKLINTLLRQNSSNQLILATHSPFIYSMYEDKELLFEVSK